MKLYPFDTLRILVERVPEFRSDIFGLDTHALAVAQQIVVECRFQYHGHVLRLGKRLRLVLHTYRLHPSFTIVDNDQARGLVFLAEYLEMNLPLVVLLVGNAQHYHPVAVGQHHAAVVRAARMQGKITRPRIEKRSEYLMALCMKLCERLAGSVGKQLSLDFGNGRKLIGINGK